MQKQRFSSLQKASLVFVFALLTVFSLAESKAAFQELHRRPAPTRPDLPAPLKLKMPLRSTASLRFSPNGEFLLVQDSSGIFVLSVAPLQPVAFFGAPLSYPARFSADSSNLIVVSYGLEMARWHLPDAKTISHGELPIEGGCLDATLSNDGTLLACYRPNLVLALIKLESGEVTASIKLADEPAGDSRYTIIPLDRHTAFAGSFGFAVANNIDPLADRGLMHLPAFFSQDGTFMLADGPGNACRIDLATGKKSKLPSPFQKRNIRLAALLPDDRVLTVSAPEQSAALLSMKNGEAASSLSIRAASVTLSSNPKFALLRDSAFAGVHFFDIEKNSAVAVPENASADIFGDTLAILSNKGEVSLQRLGESSPSKKADLPLAALPVLRSARVSAVLDRLAIAVDGAGGIFDLSTGRNLTPAPFEKFTSFFFAEGNLDYFSRQNSSDSANEGYRIDLTAGTPAKIWERPKDFFLVSGGPVLLGYSFETFQTNIPTIDVSSASIPYRLVALDPSTGKELWGRSFHRESPVPFADPQGNNFVLGWNADSNAAHEIARSYPALKDAYKKAKISKFDTLFEVCDVRTGKHRAALLLQSGGGAAHFDSAFAEGDSFMLEKESFRLSVFSLKTGEQIARINGYRPAASSAANLLVVDLGSGRLGVFDLSTGAKLNELALPQAIAYLHFSEDGRKLLVLTELQEVYILESERIRTAAPSPPNPQTATP